MKPKHIISFILGGMCGAALFSYSGSWIPVLHSEEELFVPAMVLFTGDIMLARTVERWMDALGSDYPFLGTESLIRSADVAIGNFEASVPEVHVPTPNFTFSFSVKEGDFQALADAGFDALSLANNHALDHGREGYAHTREICLAAHIHCFGHPTITEPETVVLQAGSTRVGLMGLHTLFSEPQISVIAHALEELALVSDVQIVYVHWGTEYELLHNAAQEALAHALIDAGADAVVGHHPHVVQDIALYRGKPIFYSLGNFVFDQYFSDDVQQGLVLTLYIEKDHMLYKLIPVSTIGSLSQPQIPAEAEAAELLDSIFARSSGLESVREYDTLRISR